MSIFERMTVILALLAIGIALLVDVLHPPVHCM